MANTFGILTALVLALSTFVAFKNKEEYQTQINATKAQEKDLDRNMKTFDKLREKIAALGEEKIIANKSRDENQVKLEAQEETNVKLEEEQKTKKSDLDETESRVKEKKEKLAELGEIENLGPKIERLTAAITELQDSVAIAKAQNSKLRNEKTTTDNVSTSASKKLSDLTSGRSLATMRTRISSVSQTLGFVTLSGGLNSGVVGGSKVAVMRGGEKIAEMNVTAVSANAATADVIQSTLREGERVSSGDTVIPIEVASK